MARAFARLRRPRPYPVPVAPPGTVLGAATAVVTGAAGALGSALVAALADSGADVWSLDRRPLDAARPGRSLPCDLTIPAQVDAAADAVLAGSQDGTLLLFHAAGTMGVDSQGLAAASPSVWAEVYATHVIGPVQLMQRLVPAMAPGSGVVFVSSVNQEVPSPWPHYAASKAAVAKLVEDLAADLAPRGIRVNGVAPARFTAGGAVNPQPDHPLHGTDVPLEAVVHACLFLADPQLSPATTGVILRIDGGLGVDHPRVRASMT